MEKLVSGILKFQQEEFDTHKELFNSLAKGQDPEVLFITCSDSRIDPGARYRHLRSHRLWGDERRHAS